jgi:hypothetical protein
VSRRLATGDWRLAVRGAMGLGLAAVLAGCGGHRLGKIMSSGNLIDLSIAGKQIQAELAMDDPSRQRGLMYRKSMPEDQGMLFIYPRAQKLQFWMRNTSIPLSIAFIDDEGKILQIEDLRPHDERRVGSKDEVRFALETNRGWFDKNGLKPGSTFDGFRKRVSGLDSR